MENSLDTIVIYNASNIFPSMTIVDGQLNTRCHTFQTVDELHTRCIAHVANLASKICLSIEYQKKSTAI